MALEGIDLLDLDRFQRLEHWEMFDRLRQEAPVYWHDYPAAQGFWNVTQHADLITVNRDPGVFSSRPAASASPPTSRRRGATIPAA